MNGPVMAVRYLWITSQTGIQINSKIETGMRERVGTDSSPGPGPGSVTTRSSSFDRALWGRLRHDAPQDDRRLQALTVPGTDEKKGACIETRAF